MALKRWVLVCFLAELLCQNVGNGARDSSGITARGTTLALVCGGNCSCVVAGGGDTDVQYFYYDEDLKTCQALPPSCDVSSQCATFSILETCQHRCNYIGGCASSRWGCCPDGETPRNEKGTNCPKGEEEPDTSESSGVRWDLVTAGICATVILLGVISLVGVAMYAYRHKHKQRQRSRYIQEILQMYDSTGISDSNSDSSYISDNPEHNNLFDRL